MPRSGSVWPTDFGTLGTALYSSTITVSLLPGFWINYELPAPARATNDSEIRSFSEGRDGSKMSKDESSFVNFSREKLQCYTHFTTTVVSMTQSVIRLAQYMALYHMTTIKYTMELNNVDSGKMRQEIFYRRYGILLSKIQVEDDLPSSENREQPFEKRQV
ncbi:hypothetical protein WN51_07591 [Melipona quadrifasciata]|uniref:Uncharacterized protein n=1 Tax=Melipona quadrifasciata TaxID=166423 RepID=A0A0M8ZPC2_9HYME|nr:hypothetical protein WN51_07591 [Melipona quadrifasciata]